MALIPLNQQITVNRGGGLDDWGNEIAGEEFTLACRLSEGSSAVANRSGGNVTSKEEVAEARILFDKLADVRYADEISFTNELGETIRRKPKEINVKRMLNGKPVLTEVFI